MANTADNAARWTEFLARHTAFPAGERLRRAFSVGRITRLCDCGCNSFDIVVPDGTVDPLATPGSHGVVFEIDFHVNEPGSDDRRSLEIIVFADDRGHLAGIEVDYCGNSCAVPHELVIHEPPYHVRCSDAIAA
jgi:hypothetical protein